MLYNSAISYNQPSIRYNGTLILNVPGLSNPIIINEVSLIFEFIPDYSNNTTIGILTLESDSTGIITLDLTSSQSAVLSQSISQTQNSAEIIMDLTESQAILVSQSIDQSQNYAEITLDFI